LFSGFGLWRRPRLITDQIHFIGNYSLVIIAVSGLFVGFVLGYQGYYTLNRFGSGESLGLLVTISLVRELGPSSLPCYLLVSRYFSDSRNWSDEGG
jgi:phospholipid/cholesterol/gamma-HCH transport system permease protein